MYHNILNEAFQKEFNDLTTTLEEIQKKILTIEEKPSWYFRLYFSFIIVQLLYIFN
jgi:hypothetical protein